VRCLWAAATRHQLRNWAILLTFPLDALAHLGLARAFALQGDTAKAPRGAGSSIERCSEVRGVGAFSQSKITTEGHPISCQQPNEVLAD
jgi:hypothetical protein